MRILKSLAGAALALSVLAGCAGQPTVTRNAVSQSEVEGLADAIRDLGPGVDPAEADRAARIAYDYARQLAVTYNVTDPPLVHNAKVNSGIRERGICVHWAEDIEARLKQENFRTLQLHRAIADPDNPFRVDHSTAIISRRGDTLYQGIVLDGWRNSGDLHWAPTLADTRYNWRPRLDVLYDKQLARERRQAAAAN
ncbi:hypothetical protein [Primorskyibacter sp. S87]|uniref:hypothetical protein n=1 Tax=Primorskyibacter sp. S87 TaxID=3415126 RepID=UPI003C7CE1F4